MTTAFDPIFGAVAEGDAAALAVYLAAGGDPNKTNTEGFCLLMLAAVAGDIAVVKSLLSAGADPNLTSPSGMTALKYATSKDHREVAQVLLKAGARPMDVAVDQGEHGDDAFRMLFGDPSMNALKALYKNVSTSSAYSPAGKVLPIEKRASELRDETSPDAASPKEVEPPPAEEPPAEEVNIDDFIGQAAAKQALAQIIAVAKLNQERVKRSLPELKLNFHAVFTGSPGTGKTTFARFYAQEVKKIGMLSKGHLIEVGRADLVAEYQGQTAPKTMAVVKKALGGILFIDEAYALKGSKDDAFGQECIDTLVKAVEDHRKDLIVIFAGYEDEMRDFLQHNSGLRSRLPHIVSFEDFSGPELMQIFDLMAGKHQLVIEPAARELIADELALGRRGKSFGNGREVRNILERSLAQQSTRLARRNLDELSHEDLCRIIYSDVTRTPDDDGTYAEIKGDKPKRDDTALSRLTAMHGLDVIKNEIKHLADYVRVTKARRGGGDLGDLTLHMVFTGPPGTGKTTVARLMGSLLKEIGVLGSGHLIETDRAGLVAEYMGQTAVKTREKIEQAIGGVLFIDEAYSLSRGRDQYGQEAIDVLLKYIEDYRSKFVVILSGYEAEMQQFLRSNPGLASRFARVLHFAEFDEETLKQIAISMAEEDGFSLTSQAQGALMKILEGQKTDTEREFANARAVRNLLEQAYKKHAARMVKLGDPSQLASDVLNTLTHDDF